MSVGNGLDAVWVCFIDSQTVFLNGFCFDIKYLVLLKLDVSDSEDLAILWDPYVIDIAAIIANQVSNMCPGLGFVYHLIFIVCKNLLPN